MEPNQNLLSVLTREGVLIKVSIRYWRGCKKLRPEDIGLKESDLSDRLISLGHKRLLPKDAIAGLTLLEGRAHALVEGNTFPFLNGLGHFLPNTKLEEVTDKLKDIEVEFWQAKQQFLQRYSSLRLEAAKEWRTMAKKLVNDPERLTAAIEASFPFVTQMDRFYGFDVQLFQISLPERSVHATGGPGGTSRSIGSKTTSGTGSISQNSCRCGNLRRRLRGIAA